MSAKATAEKSEATIGSRLRKGLAVTVVLLLLALLAYGLMGRGQNKQIDESLSRGVASKAPGFDLHVLAQGQLPPGFKGGVARALSDGQLSLGELRGTPVVLNFWASWCYPCRQEAPILEDGWRTYGPQGVLFLGLNMQDLTGDARKFIDEFAISYPSIRDSGADVARSYGASGIPETYFISARGRVVAHVVGVVSADQLADGATAAKQGTVVGSSPGGARRPQR